MNFDMFFDRDIIISGLIGFVFGLVLITYGLFGAIIITMTTSLSIFFVKNKKSIGEWMSKK